MSADSEAVQTHVPCPLCGSHDAAAIYSDGHLYCFSCQGYIQGEHRKERPPMPSELLINLSYQTLEKRKITEDTCRKYSYGIAKDSNTTWQVAPYHDKTGQITAQHLRAADKKFSWRGKPKELQLYGQHLFKNGGKMVVVTEGEIDCLTVSQAQGNKWPVVSIPNGASTAAQAFKDNLEWLESFEKVIICFDMDEAGHKAAEKAAEVLSPGRAYIMELPMKDPNEMHKAGKTDQLITAIWNARPYRPDGIISGVDLWEELTKEPEKAYTTPYPKLNTLTGGIRKKELWLFTAGTGIGKSTAVHEIAYHLMQEHHLKIGVIALEESKKRAAERYLTIYLNHPLHINRTGITEHQLREAYENTIGRQKQFYLYDHFGSTDIETLMSRIRYMAVTCQIDFLVLDHISIVVSGLKDSGADNERKQIDQLMTALRSLVEETGIGVLGISHLKRPSAGESWNNGKEPNLTDLRGSGGLEQLADTVIAMSRNQKDQQTPNQSKLIVLKNRYTGIIGEADTLEYSLTTGRLKAIQQANTNPFIEEEREPNEKKQPQKTPVPANHAETERTAFAENTQTQPIQTLVAQPHAENDTEIMEGELDF